MNMCSSHFDIGECISLVFHVEKDVADDNEIISSPNNYNGNNQVRSECPNKSDYYVVEQEQHFVAANFWRKNCVRATVAVGCGLSLLLFVGSRFDSHRGNVGTTVNSV